MAAKMMTVIQAKAGVDIKVEEEIIEEVTVMISLITVLDNPQQILFQIIFKEEEAVFRTRAVQVGEVKITIVNQDKAKGTAGTSTEIRDHQRTHREGDTTAARASGGRCRVHQGAASRR